MSETVIELKRFNDKCRHNKYIVDPQLATVECAICGEKLNPIWVLTELSHKEARARNVVDDLKEQAEKTKNKLRCKCQHCGEMTRILR